MACAMLLGLKREHPERPERPRRTFGCFLPLKTEVAGGVGTALNAGPLQERKREREKRKEISQ